MVKSQESFMFTVGKLGMCIETMVPIAKLNARLDAGMAVRLCSPSRVAVLTAIGLGIDSAR